MIKQWYKFLSEELKGYRSYSYSPMAVELIKKFEKFKPAPYQNEGDLPTIGYGTRFYVDDNGKQKQVTMGDNLEISKEAANRYIINYLNFVVMPSLNRYLKESELTQNQIDALASVMYNKGNSSFLRSDIFTFASRNPDDPRIKEAFLKDAEGKDPGILKRRMAEYQIYSSKGVYDNSKQMSVKPVKKEPSVQRTDAPIQSEPEPSDYMTVAPIAKNKKRKVK